VGVMGAVLVVSGIDLMLGFIMRGERESGSERRD
jgi:hypothetical protein